MIPKERLAAAFDDTIAWLKTNPDNRGKFRTAVDAEGKLVSMSSAEACRFCAFGYLGRQLGVEGWKLADVLDAIGHGVLGDDPKSKLVFEVIDSNDAKGKHAALDAAEAMQEYRDAVLNTS